eukprot:5581239-Pyramimonas_sp.AAC.1
MEKDDSDPEKWHALGRERHSERLAQSADPKMRPALQRCTILEPRQPSVCNLHVNNNHFVQSCV